jgi:hypothetical protein
MDCAAGFYERGTDRVAASRLFRISQVLDVEIAEMFKEQD